ncbi:hypothetical protein H6F47_00865 [Sphaerospermopsis sp. FACHB-1094]|uniref:hypothetical protein n=1 Tax=Sphaerospermopsis sp. FACHB-1094 TaxID=2692861 RepID=UPI00168A1EB4|nr:hypothetical protein [Sphaerospermopsis sp. FACHB-1094]MBD2131053.1 hypothetical protein [Sphaerospermopsis sp. FACHB-1094]
MSAIINNYRQLDVAFLLLNDLTTKLRTAGARISVRKVGNFHRITVLKEPTVATIEQILGDTSGETETPHLSSNNAITSSSESTPSPDDAVSEAGSNTVPTVNEEIEDNSVVEAIALPTSSESTSSTDDTSSEDSANTVPTLNEDIEDNSVVEAIALPTSSESTSSPDESHTGDSKDIISENTAEIITNSTDSPTPDNSSSDITNIPNSPELASLEDLQTLTLKRLRELAKLHKVPGFSRMKEEKLVTKLHGLVTKEQIV